MCLWKYVLQFEKCVTIAVLLDENERLLLFVLIQNTNRDRDNLKIERVFRQRNFNKIYSILSRNLFLKSVVDKPKNKIAKTTYNWFVISLTRTRPNDNRTKFVCKARLASRKSAVGYLKFFWEFACVPNVQVRARCRSNSTTYHNRSYQLAATTRATLELGAGWLGAVELRSS